MKLRLTLLLATAIIFVMSSCTHEYKCDCSIVYSGLAGLPDSSIKEYSIRDTKATAKSLCEGASFTSDSGGIHTVERCYLY